MTRAARSRRSTWPSSTSASRRGVSTPAASSATTAESSASRTGVPAIGRSAGAGGGLGFEPAALLVGRERGGELVERALEDGVEVVHRDLDAVVGDAALAVVVGA